MNATATNVDPGEISKFDSSASRWWDSEGPYKTLHEINPLRLGYIEQRARLDGSAVIDVGCGGGILAESMAGKGARVTGIDLAESALAVARLHASENGGQRQGSLPNHGFAALEYRAISAEQLADEAPASADIVTCMELLEHVPDPAALIEACGRLVRPGGDIFLSTINRNPKSYLFAIIGAEYLLRMLPAGTHDYARFIRPSELGRWLRAAGLDLRELTGLSYQPLTGRYTLGRDISVNYLVHAVRPES